MDKIKNKYEIILGFVTLIVSLSAFKNELSGISFNLGYLTINSDEYFLYCVLGFSVCLYLYILEQVIRDTRILFLVGEASLNINKSEKSNKPCWCFIATTPF